MPIRQRPQVLGVYACLAEGAPAGARLGPLLPLVATQPPPYPAVQLLPDPRRRRAPVVGEPAVGVGAQLGQYVGQSLPPIAAGEATHALLEPLQGRRSEVQSRVLAVAPEAVAQELALHRSGHRALLGVDLQAEGAFQEPRDRGHHPRSRPLAPDVDVAVVRVATEAMPPARQ